MDNYAITTVITPASSFDLTTLKNAKLDLSITSNDDDIYIRDRLIPQASRAVEQFCNRQFALQTYQDEIHPQRDPRPYFLPNGRQPMYVHRTPLVSVTSVTEKDIALVAGTDYEVDLENGYVYRLDEFGYPKPWPAYKIVIVYQSGWTLPGTLNSTLPADVEDACIRMIKSRRASRTRDPFLKSDTVDGIGSQDYWITAGSDGGNMPPDVQDILLNYRVSTFA